MLGNGDSQLARPAILNLWPIGCVCKRVILFGLMHLTTGKSRDAFCWLVNIFKSEDILTKWTALTSVFCPIWIFTHRITCQKFQLWLHRNEWELLVKCINAVVCIHIFMPSNAWEKIWLFVYIRIFQFNDMGWGCVTYCIELTTSNHISGFLDDIPRFTYFFGLYSTYERMSFNPYNESHS